MINYGYSVEKMYAIQAPTVVSYRKGEVSAHLEAKPGDVVCVMSHKCFDDEILVITNDKLFNNLVNRHIKDQEEKIKWAESKKNYDEDKCKEGGC